MNKEQLLQLLNKHHIEGKEMETMSGSTYLEWVVGFEDMFDFINDVRTNYYILLIPVTLNYLHVIPVMNLYPFSYLIIIFFFY